MAHDDRRDDEKRDGDDRPLAPFLLIPYNNNDKGVRPLPNGVPFWHCPSIQIDGVPYTGQQLDAGTSYDLTCRVRNLGGVASTAVLSMFWADPTVGFTESKLHLIGQATVYLPSLADKSTTAISWLIGDDTPGHCCLLARLSAPADAAGPASGSSTDRHYGQQNLSIHHAAAGDQVSMQVDVPVDAELVARPVEDTRALRRILGLPVARDVSSDDIEVVEARGDGRTRAVEIVVRIPDGAQAGTVRVYELVAYSRDIPAGGVALAIVVD